MEFSFRLMPFAKCTDLSVTGNSHLNLFMTTDLKIDEILSIGEIPDPCVAISTLDLVTSDVVGPDLLLWAENISSLYPICIGIRPGVSTTHVNAFMRDHKDEIIKISDEYKQKIKYQGLNYPLEHKVARSHQSYPTKQIDEAVSKIRSKGSKIKITSDAPTTAIERIKREEKKISQKPLGVVTLAYAYMSETVRASFFAILTGKWIPEDVEMFSNSLQILRLDANVKEVVVEQFSETAINAIELNAGSHS